MFLSYIFPYNHIEADDLFVFDINNSYFNKKNIDLISERMYTVIKVINQIKKWIHDIFYFMGDHNVNL